MLALASQSIVTASLSVCPASNAIAFTRCEGAAATASRSEEHTSELQSLLLISYAVFFFIHISYSFFFFFSFYFFSFFFSSLFSFLFFFFFFFSFFFFFFF